MLVDLSVTVGSFGSSQFPQLDVVFGSDGLLVVLDQFDQLSVLVFVTGLLLVVLDQSDQFGSVLVLVTGLLLVLDQVDHSGSLLVGVFGLLLVVVVLSQSLHEGSVLVLTGVLVVELQSDQVDGSVLASGVLLVDDHSVQVGSALVVVELDQPSHPSAVTEPRRAAVAAIVVVFMLNPFPSEDAHKKLMFTLGNTLLAERMPAKRVAR